MPGQDGQSAQETYGRRLTVEEFLVDFLGGLVPGVLFLGASTFALLSPIHALTMALLAPSPTGVPRTSLLETITLLIKATANTPSAIWVMVLIGAALLSYIIGHLFYRHDPKIADKSSFRRLKRQLEFNTPEKRIFTLGCAEEEDCEFPYPNIHDYLEKRGLDHLVPFVLWKKNRDHRSKNYINILKIRLRHYYPDKCGAIIRNEAHVRLASSTWYVAKLLFWVGITGMLISIVSFILSLSDTTLSRFATNLSWHSSALLPPLIVSILSAYSWWVIRGFLHYQRMREVIFVLETAFSEEIQRKITWDNVTRLYDLAK